ncbi:hypothetical protein D4R75_08720 [bacterium]|nr:MAG: hypothetical protein D4R75_08720 [bacterium]
MADNEKRIARLCWNLNGWVMPSGPHGKSKHKNSHEALYGFGHEEWLFDTSKVIDGYHYGFLEPVRKQQSAYENSTYDVWLYSIDGQTKKRYWVGDIEGVEVIDSTIAEEIKNLYTQKNWLEEMKQQLTKAGAKIGNLSSGPGIDIFNVRYLPANLKINEQYAELSPGISLYRLSRYVFANYSDEFDVLYNDDEFVFMKGDDTQNDDDGELKTKKHSRKPKEIEITYLHDVIAKGLTKRLRGIHGKENVTPNHPAGYGANKVDIVVRNGKELTFYEIKTYNSVKTSIREAIGQIMEYSLWTNHNRARQLIVVTQPHNDIDKAKTYFRHLRETYGLPIYFQTYDFENDILSEEF